MNQFPMVFSLQITKKWIPVVSVITEVTIKQLYIMVLIMFAMEFDLNTMRNILQPTAVSAAHLSITLVHMCT